MVGRIKERCWRCEGVCINPDGISCDSFLVRITSSDGSPFQEIALSAESRIMPTGAAHWEDVNFDGEPDVLVHLGGGRGGTQGYAVVLWDGADVGFQLDLSAWEYWNGNLVKTHRLLVSYNSPTEQSGFFVEYELKNGALSEIQSSVVILNNMKDIDTYITTYTAWEGWKWCNVQHFQQKG